MSHSGYVDARQLPITNFAHKAAVVGDGRVAAGIVLATRHMPAESRRAAALDRAHHLQLAEADVAAVGVTPRRPVAAEDIRDLQQWPGHGRRALRRRPILRQGQTIERAGDSSQQVGGNLGIARGRVELCMAQKNLDDTHVGMALQGWPSMGRKLCRIRKVSDALTDQKAHR
jgi:hypothetical protein